MPVDIYHAYVYIARSDNGLTKIGVSRNVQQRIKALSGASGFSLTLEDAQLAFCPHAVERGLHLFFASKRKQGEWFDLGDDEIKEAKRLLETPYMLSRLSFWTRRGLGSPPIHVQRHFSPEAVITTVYREKE